MADRLEYRENNAYSHILLVDIETGHVRSEWLVTPKSLANFLDASQDAAEWDDQHMIDDETPADTYGTLLAWRASGEGVQLAPDMANAAERLARFQGN